LGLAAFANSHVEVDGWLLLMPSFTKALDLNAPKFALFADALPFDFPASYAEADWDEGGAWTEWYRTARQVLERADGVITLSRHVATRHVARLFGVDPQKIKPIPLAAPDRRGDLPFLRPDRRRTDDSRRGAAEILREHAVRRQWPYLVGFPFDEVDYVAISTQDRASKNIPIVIEAVRRLIRRDHQNIKIFMTTILHENNPHCRVPQSLREARLHLDAVSMPELPNREHAAFYHCAAVTVHPSLFEGGDTALPFGESVGLGTPCLLAFGPHTAELLESYPELSPWVFDPYDADGLARLIRETIADRERVLDRQMASYERMRERRWADVAGEYADAIVGRLQ
jgi:glycosyltransferase involved in cell wall biosynthesis